MTEAITERRRIAGYMAEHGPMHGDRLAGELGLSLERFWGLINCPWFDIVTGGWGLTDRGRTEAMGDPTAVCKAERPLRRTMSR